MDESEARTVSARRRAVDFVGYVVVRLFVSVMQAMPFDMADSLCRLLAKLFSHVIVVRGKTLTENMLRVTNSNAGNARKVDALTGILK